MQAYKSVEKPSKIFGLTFMDWVVIGGFIVFTMLVLSIIGELGIEPKWWWTRGFILLGLITLYKLLSWANKNKAPNYLIAWFSYNLLQNKKIEPTCQILSQHLERSSRKTAMEIQREKKG